jgi:trehalose synthase
MAGDKEGNALLVNALQRRADIVVQKSLREGFGLTTTEAMFKRKPVVVSGVGGLGLQVENGVSGLVVDPRDGETLASSIDRLLENPALCCRLGDCAAASVMRRYMMPRLVGDYLQLFANRGDAASNPGPGRRRQ